MGYNVYSAGDLIEYSIGGGWGKEEPQGDFQSQVAIIRGADFPSIEQGIYAGLPIRWEKQAKANKAALQVGDIILEISGGTDDRPTGRTLYVTEIILSQYDCPVIPASFCRLVRPGEAVDSAYFFYWLQNMYAKGRTWGYQNRSTGLSNFQFKVFADLEQVLVPSMDTQRSIAELLLTIEDKRHLNNRTNDYLEQSLLDQYDHLFGTHADYDGTIADIGEVVGGATPSKKKAEYYCTDGIGWITPRDLSNTSDKFIAHGADDITQLGYDSCSVKMLPAGTVLFSSRAPIGYIAIATEKVTTNQGFKSVVPKPEVGTAFVYCFLKRNKDRIADAGSGTTFPEVSGKTMAGIELSLPDVELCSEFSEWAEPLLAQQRCLEEENRKLGDLRDTLLPKLMSGEIDVSEIEIPTQSNNHLSAG